MIKREGTVDLRLVPGAPSMDVRSSVQSAGSGPKIRAAALLEAVSCGGDLMHELRHYTAIFIRHIEVLDRALLDSQTGGFYQARGETPHPVWLTA